MPERAIDQAIAAYGKSAMQSVTIPEWGDLEVFFSPVTVGDMKFVESKKPKTEYDSTLHLIIRKAKAADGSPLFTIGDKPKLEADVDAAGMVRLAEAMTRRIPKSTEAAKKEVESDPTEPS
jgi:hypothetical protein